MTAAVVIGAFGTALLLRLVADAPLWTFVFAAVWVAGLASIGLRGERVKSAKEKLLFGVVSAGATAVFWALAAA